jgi:hypothetical protein
VEYGDIDEIKGFCDHIRLFSILLKENLTMSKNKIILTIAISIAIIIAGGFLISAVTNNRKIDPKNVDARVGLGKVYIKLERFKDTEDILKEAMEIDPKSPEPYFELARFYILQQRSKEAVEILEKGAAINKNEEILKMINDLKPKNPEFSLPLPPNSDISNINGRGTEEDPYIVRYERDLVGARDWDRSHAVLVNTIVVLGFTELEIIWNDGINAFIDRLIERSHRERLTNPISGEAGAITVSAISDNPGPGALFIIDAVPDETDIQNTVANPSRAGKVLVVVDEVQGRLTAYIYGYDEEGIYIPESKRVAVWPH